MNDKIAYIVDSSCFLSKEEVEKKGLFFLSLHLIIDGVDYKEGETLDKAKLIEAISEKRNITTSQPSPGEIIELINKLKREGYDYGVFSSIGSGLSKTIENMASTAHSENFKIYTLDSGSVGQAQLSPLLKLKEMVEIDQEDFQTAYEMIKNNIKDSKTLIVVDDLFYLSRGGRITKSAAALGSMLKIKPILTLLVEQGGVIDVAEKVRTTKKAYKKLVEIALKNRDMNNYKILIATFGANDAIEDVVEIIKKIDSSLDIEIYELTSVIGVHTGLGCVGVQVYKDWKIKEE